MTTGTISGTYTYGLTLSVNPTTVTSTGQIATTIGDALYGGSGIPWTVNNSGFVEATGSFGDGIDLQAGGRVSNASGGQIISIGTGGAGVYIGGAPGTVINAGYLAGRYTGVQLAAGGSVTNDSGARIGAGYDQAVLIQGAAGTVTNQGTVFSVHTTAISLASGGRVTNDGGAVISAASDAVVSSGDVATVTNLGVIESTGTSQSGVKLQAGGTVINETNATISADVGVYLSGGLVSISNSGVIEGLDGSGARLIAAGSVSNTGAGVISGQYGVKLDSRGSVTNSGTIEGHSVGLFATGAPATIVNSGHILGSAAVDSGAGTAANYGGIFLRAGGTVTNTGTISDDTHDAILVTGAPGTIVNSRDIAGGPTAYGIELFAGGIVTNSVGGSITGEVGIEAHGIRATVDNSGSISASVGVELQQGGSLSNASGGTIAGSSGYAVFTGGTLSLVNDGVIKGTGTDGFVLEFGSGTITNQSDGVITGGAGAIVGGSPGATVINDGMISATDYGVALVGAAPNLVDNAAGARISAQLGVELAGTVVNAGTILGGATSGVAVNLFSGIADRLVVDPGASFRGTVSGGNTIGSTIASTLEFAKGTATGTLGGLGTQFIDFGSIVVDAGATWHSAGANTVEAGQILTDLGTLDFVGGFANAGTVLVNGGTLFNSLGKSGAGLVELKAHAVDSVSYSSTGTVDFLDATGTLDLATAATFKDVIEGFAKGDIIDLVDTKATSFTYTSPDLVIRNGTTLVATLDFKGSYTQASFAAPTTDGHGGTLIQHT